MTDYEVGYGRPPKQHQFQKGVSGNNKGRPPKPKPAVIADIIKNALNAPIQYRENGRIKTITRAEMGLKKALDSAIRGDLSAAATLLRVRASAARLGDLGVETIEVRNWIQDFAGQTGDERTREFAAATQEKPPEEKRQAADFKEKL